MTKKEKFNAFRRICRKLGKEASAGVRVATLHETQNGIPFSGVSLHGFLCDIQWVEHRLYEEAEKNGWHLYTQKNTTGWEIWFDTEDE